MEDRETLEDLIEAQTDMMQQQARADGFYVMMKTVEELAGERNFSQQQEEVATVYARRLFENEGLDPVEAAEQGIEEVA